jgi:hypothetical protein
MAMRPCNACQMPTMIIMIAANKMKPTAQPLVSSLARLADGYCDGRCSVICRSLHPVRFLLRPPLGQPASAHGRR